MLVKHHNFKHEIVELTEFQEEVSILLRKYKPEQIQIRLGLTWDSWGQEHRPITLCVYDKS